MKKIILIFLLVLSADSFSQLGNMNLSLQANINQHSPYSACWGYRARNNREYAILGCNTGTAFIDITDSTNIHEVDFQQGITSGWREMKVFSHYAYIVSEATNSGLQVVDLIYLPDSVHLVTTFTYSGYTRTHSISQSGPYLYLHGGNNTSVGGVSVVDITNPEVPVKRGSWNNVYVHDSRIVEDTIWACNIFNPPGSISVINASNKDNLTTITSWVNNPNPFPHNCAIPPFNRKYILTTDETSSPNGKLKVWDRSNLLAPVLVTTWTPTGITTAIVHNVEIYGTIAVIAHYTAGIRVVNISNPAVPIEVAWYDTYPSSNNANFAGCWGVYMFGVSGKIIGSDISTGLYVVKPTISLTGTNQNENVPASFELSQNYPNPFNPSTKINFSVPKTSHVSLKVYDLLGQQVAVLADEVKTAGSYTISYDASLLASGLYFYKLESDPETSSGFSQSKKMVLIK